jgi:hypothetical protein
LCLAVSFGPARSSGNGAGGVIGRGAALAAVEVDAGRACRDGIMNLADQIIDQSLVYIPVGLFDLYCFLRALLIDPRLGDQENSQESQAHENHDRDQGKAMFR